jgi:hypothetical protein
MPEMNPFSHFHNDASPENQAGMTPFVKKVLVLLFVVFLLLFPRYAPWAPHAMQDDTVVYQIFTLYFFVISQTLGIVHEAGHGVCYILPCPEFVMVANGTVFQLLFPGLIAYYYYKKGKRFAAWIGVFFLGLSLSYSAWYLSTAHEGALLPAHKSFLGVDALHDFHYMLSATGLLAYESLLTSLTRLVAYLLMGISVLGMFLDAFSNEERAKKLKKRNLK